MTRPSNCTLSITLFITIAFLLGACGEPSTYEGGGRGGTGSRSPNVVPTSDTPDAGASSSSSASSSGTVSDAGDNG